MPPAFPRPRIHLARPVRRRPRQSHLPLRGGYPRRCRRHCPLRLPRPLRRQYRQRRPCRRHRRFLPPPRRTAHHHAAASARRRRARAPPRRDNGREATPIGMPVDSTPQSRARSREARTFPRPKSGWNHRRQRSPARPTPPRSIPSRACSSSSSPLPQDRAPIASARRALPSLQHRSCQSAPAQHRASLTHVRLQFAHFMRGRARPSPILPGRHRPAHRSRLCC